LFDSVWYESSSKELTILRFFNCVFSLTVFINEQVLAKVKDILFWNFEKKIVKNYFLLQGPVRFILCYLGLPNEFQHSKDQLKPFSVNTFISTIQKVVLFNLGNPQPTPQMAGPDMQT
jgi:hypothetical protein